MAERSASWALLAILLAGALLRFTALGSWSLWLDEMHTLLMADHTTPLTLRDPGDQHPPLYYLVMHYWSQPSQAEWWLRLPSALAGCLTVAVLWRAGAALGSGRLGLLAAALLALSPLHVWYSREARMYALAGLAWALSLDCWARFVRDGRWRDAVGLAAVTLLGLYLAYPTAALWAGEAALALASFIVNGTWRERAVRWLAAQLLVVVGCLPWLPSLDRQLRRGIVFDWNRASPANADALANGAGRGWLEPLFGALSQLPLTADLGALVALGCGLAAVFAGLVIGAALLLARRPALLASLKRLSVPAAILVCLGCGAVTVLGAIPIGLSIRRQLLVLWLPAVLIWAWALLRLRARALPAICLAGSALLASAMLLAGPYEDWRGAAARLGAGLQPDDAVLLDPLYVDPLFIHYAPNATGAVLRGAGSERAAAETAFDGARRVWLVRTRQARAVDPRGLVEASLAARGELVASYPFNGVELRLYRAR